MNTTYLTFVKGCENIAKELHSVVDITVYKKTGLAFISFMTEKFGDAYVQLHYDINKNKVLHCFGLNGLKKKTEITELPQLKEFVRIEHYKLMRNKQFRNKKIASIDIDKEDKTMNRMELQNYCDHNPHCNHQCAMCPAYEQWSRDERWYGDDDEDDDE